MPNKPSHFVAIGASAGGLEAIEEVFAGLPANTGMAFIVVQHLSSEYKSLMGEILAKHTPMPISTAESEMPLEANHIYLIPPRHNLTISGAKLLLIPRETRSTPNLPIDIFLRSLASDQGDKSVAIILSGTGSDGSRGIRNIKEEGGLVIVQDETTAHFDGMPRNAQATGLADFILPPFEIAAQLLSYIQHPAPLSTTKSTAKYETTLQTIYNLIKNQENIDFTFYKQSTLLRRIERRMVVNQVDSLEKYLNVLKLNPAEISLLSKEMLIGVTSFFRDPGAFRLLADRLLKAYMSTFDRREFRIWVVGCSTGEEAYTITMIVHDHFKRNDIDVSIRVFATDIDSKAINRAGTGDYPESIAADVPNHYLANYFVRLPDGTFQVSRTLRELIVFARHDVTRDPPFTSVDLISCRNLLIYLQTELQQKVLDYFNFSLVPGGTLFLGKSESILQMNNHFEKLDSTWRFYRSLGIKKPMTGMNILRRYNIDQGNAHTSNHDKEASFQQELLLDKVFDVLSSEFFQCGVVVNEKANILHVLGDTTGILHLPPGRLQPDLKSLVAEQVSVILTSALNRSFREKSDNSYHGISIRHFGKSKIFDIMVRYMGVSSRLPELVLVLFVNADHQNTEGNYQTFEVDEEAQKHIFKLEQELKLTHESLHATIEELETSNEELQSSNEELISSNEELQSTNEELQSVNEELFTVNAEYQQQVAEISAMSDDIFNLLNNNVVLFLLVDEQLNIRLFSKGLSRVLAIEKKDIGSSLKMIEHHFNDFDLGSVADSTIEQQTLNRFNLQTQNGKWFETKVYPYRLKNRGSQGLVFEFLDVTSQIESQETIRQQASILATLEEAVVVTNLQGIIVFWNRRAEELYGYHEKEVLQKKLVDILVPQTARDKAEKIIQQVSTGNTWRGRLKVQNKRAELFEVHSSNSLLYSAEGKLQAIIAMTIPI